MSNLIWSKEYSVNVKEIDDQHKKLVNIIEELTKSFSENSIKEKLGNILEDLIEYAGFHFYTEELYFDKFDYEFKDEHKEEHKGFTENIKKFQKEFKKDEIKISFELVEYLENWLVNHVLDSDKKYSECFNKHGLY